MYRTVPAQSHARIGRVGGVAGVGEAAASSSCHRRSRGARKLSRGDHWVGRVGGVAVEKTLMDERGGLLDIPFLLLMQIGTKIHLIERTGQKH